MIHTKKELAFYIKADRMMNRNCFVFPLRTQFKNIFFPDFIMSYLEAMRKCQYYSNVGGGINRILFLFYKAKYRRLGIKLGFSIGQDVFGYGLVLPHYGTIVVGNSNRIGNYAVLHTSTCISDNGKRIGDGLYLATGAKITSPVVMGDGISVGANSLVNKSFEEGFCLIGGMPANRIKDSSIWYEREGSIYNERVTKIEELKVKLLCAS